MIGVDEVGRGAWAGPLLMAAVNYRNTVKGLKDSKVLSLKKRQTLAAEILKTNEAGFGWVSNDEIDDIGLSGALKLAAARALNELNYNNQPIISDGNVNFYPLLSNSSAIVKADATIEAVSAASIIAKVTRDNRMIELTDNYSRYGFEKNVGYGTAYHKRAIDNYGLCDLHRKSFKIIK